MQDKKVHEREEGLVDLGWQRMAALLATEMPVAAAAQSDKRRGLLWFWWLALAGLLAVGASIYFTHSKSVTPAQPPVVQPAPAMAQTETIPSATGLEAAADSEAVAAAAEKMPNTSAGMPTLDLSPRLPQPRLAALRLQTEASVDAIPTVRTNDYQLFSDVNNVEAMAVAHTMAASPTIPGAPFAELELPKTTPQWAVQPVRRLSKKLRFGAELVAGGDVSQAINSFAAGPVVEWKPGRRIAVQSGLLYGGTSHKLETGRHSPRNLDTQAPNNPFTAIQVVAVSVYNGSNWNLQLRSLQLPVIASYQITPRIRLESGLTSARVWVSGDPGVNADVENFTSGTASNQYDQLQLERAVGASTAQWEWVASAGIQYRITPNTALRLHYQHGLNDLLADSSLQARQRGWKMSGLTYF
ncbi:MAG: outer membrane beta-barrel protein [Saprospiraceae bacterium]|nr:outer membrane beta-barrel protein [Saprospiraceae bacterium]